MPTFTDVDQVGSVDLVAAGWDKNLYVWDFNGTWNAANAPWPRFHANLHNNGRLGFAVPTPVQGARFSFAVGEKGIDLEWYVPAEAGRVFEVERAEVATAPRRAAGAAPIAGTSSSVSGSITSQPSTRASTIRKTFR